MPAARATPTSAAALVLLLLLGACIPKGERPLKYGDSTDYGETTSEPKSGPATGREHYIHGTEATPAIVAVDKESLKDLIRASNHRNYAALARMETQGRIFLLTADTRVDVVGGGFVETEVLIAEGPRAGRSAWLPSEWVLSR